MGGQVISLVIFSLIVVIILIDIVPICKDWILRIHIGRYKDKNEWNKSITTIGVKWLNNTPKVKLTDNTRLVVLDMLRGNYTRSAIQHWQEASLVLGISEYLKYNEDKDMKNQIIKFLNSKFDEYGQWKDKPQYIDGAMLAYAVMKLEFLEIDKYKKALDYIWEIIKKHIGEDDTVQYRNHMKSYRYVDTIGFICPFLVLYGTKYNKDECLELAVKQIEEYEKHGFLDRHHIPCHAYKLEDKIPLGVYGWGRGIGWFAIGIIDGWNELTVNHKYKQIFEKSVTKFADAVISFQQDNGSWNWTVTRSECRADSSTTAILGWFMLNASKIESISKKSLVSADKAMKYLMRVTRKNGAVDFSQGDTKDIGVYSSLFNILPFTQGFCIRCINLFENYKEV
ncbi:glycoside hydrolase family 88 protein [Oceanirhabdus sp. W0125-5]|uniref:glycoside hydrolase family 88 protein n=1 Tax=Oceanirhabdus sp. W0125-5 TaxID=2999116 RepID=UPI0022F2FDF8|nr:glycoside hydrolase family 88 protein [Oceanirhabdus sp. W0125-5]WBW98958.1 glycoside hydrolase family 88 protein [Oceanirhabdus sp. W0125-5]